MQEGLILILNAPLRLTVTVAEALRFAPMTFNFLSDIALSIFWSAKMAPHPGIDTDHIREKARKDLLDLLEGVCKAQQYILQVPGMLSFPGPWKEEPGD